MAEKASDMIWQLRGNASAPNLRLHSGTGWLYPPGEACGPVPRGSNGAQVVAIRLRIGTRKSAMALAQTEEIARRLTAVAPDIEVEIVKFETTGDRDQTSKLLPHGGKGGAFVAA